MIAFLASYLNKGWDPLFGDAQTRQPIGDGNSLIDTGRRQVEFVIGFSTDEVPSRLDRQKDYE